MGQSVCAKNVAAKFPSDIPRAVTAFLTMFANTGVIESSQLMFSLPWFQRVFTALRFHSVSHLSAEKAVLSQASGQTVVH